MATTADATPRAGSKKTRGRAQLETQAWELLAELFDPEGFAGSAPLGSWLRVD